MRRRALEDPPHAAARELAEQLVRRGDEGAARLALRDVLAQPRDVGGGERTGFARGEQHREIVAIHRVHQAVPNRARSSASM